jgi:hypothetical protein
LIAGTAIVSLESCANIEVYPVLLAKSGNCSEIYCSNDCPEAYLTRADRDYLTYSNFNGYNDSAIGVGLSFRIKKRE